MVTLAVFTTAMGLFASFAQDMHKAFPKVSYLNWLRVIAAGSFITANAGLTNIVAWAVPVLMLMYPFALSLIALSLLAKFFNRSAIVYQMVMVFVIGPACLDALSNSPVSVVGWVSQIVTTYHQVVPLAAQGMGWVVPGMVGLMLGYAVYRVQTLNAKKIDIRDTTLSE